MKNTIELNDNNCKEYTDVDFDSKLAELGIDLSEDNIEDDIKKLHKLCSKKVSWKVDGKITQESIDHTNEKSIAFDLFTSKYGADCLMTFRLLRSLKTRLSNVPLCLNKTQRQSNSKGNGYGNSI